MSVASLTKDLPDLAAADAPAPEGDEHLKKLFDLFRQIGAALADCEDGDPKAAGLIEAQTVVVRTAAAVPARTMRDVLYKLAIWRWDAPDLDKPTDEMSRGEAVAYSAFRDLVKALGEDTVLKDFDKAN